ncbi:hypothetical protein ACF0H5_003301 [Mactra antiquata]
MLDLRVEEVYSEASSILSSSPDNSLKNGRRCSESHSSEGYEKWSAPNTNWEEETDVSSRPILGSNKNASSSLQMNGEDNHSNDIWPSCGRFFLPEPWQADKKPVEKVSVKTKPLSIENSACRNSGNSIEHFNDYTLFPVQLESHTASKSSSFWTRSNNNEDHTGHPNQSNGRENGALCSTGFYREPDVDNIGSSLRNVTSFEELGRNLDALASYPEYSNGLNIDPNAALKQMAFMMSRRLAQEFSSDDNCGRSISPIGSGMYCAFCKKNKERKEFYTTHVVKDRKGKVICPVLREYSCPYCRATGDNAHTRSHCPLRPTMGFREFVPAPSIDYE